MDQQRPEKRDKREKFVGLAEKRTQRVLDSIDSLSNLATPSNYEYTERDYRKIIRTIRSSLNQMQTRFEGKETKQKGFKL
tara:strand:- start:1254 stop:1493 length:240 start_codon:yes stop_codon:yes gene_type:complete